VAALTNNAAARIYAGTVGHIRHVPFIHKFSYRLWMLCVELDRIDELAASSWLFAHNRFALLSLYDRDHGHRDGRSLRAFVQDALAAEGLGDYAARIEFMAMPRFLGYAFNPISFYYCYNATGQLGAVLHQVKNTFGGQVAYLVPVHGQGVMHQHVEKSMYVSPFFDMNGGYRFAVTPLGDKFSIAIHYGTATERRMTATMKLQAKPWSNSAVLRRLIAMPFTPLKVIAAIHIHALILFVRGAKFHPLTPQTHAAIITGDAS
jgi:DUF1365 family protein